MELAKAHLKVANLLAIQMLGLATKLDWLGVLMNSQNWLWLEAQ